MPQTPQSIDHPEAAPSKINELSKEDIARLLNADQSTSARLDISGKIANNYKVATLDKSEAIVAEQIFRLLVRDTELSIRKQMSEHLKISGVLPRDIVLTMAADVVEVALPILECSKVLSDQDLVDLITSTPDAARHVAIAKREIVSERVIGSLLDNSEHEEVAKALASNSGAKLNEANMQILIDRHYDLPQVMDVLALRPSLPANIAEKVMTHVSEQIKIHVARTYNVGFEQLADPTKKSREAATLDLIRENISSEELQKLIEQLVTFDRLGASLLIAALSQGHIGFFTLSLSMLADVPLENVTKLLKDKGGLGFRALYNKAGMQPEYFATLRDIIPHALVLREEIAGLEGNAFAQMLVKRMRSYAKEHGVILDHLIKVVEHSGK